MFLEQLDTLFRMLADWPVSQLQQYSYWVLCRSHSDVVPSSMKFDQQMQFQILAQNPPSQPSSRWDGHRGRHLKCQLRASKYQHVAWKLLVLPQSVQFFNSCSLRVLVPLSHTFIEDSVEKGGQYLPHSAIVRVYWDSSGKDFSTKPVIHAALQCASCVISQDYRIHLWAHTQSALLLHTGSPAVSPFPAGGWLAKISTQTPEYWLSSPFGNSHLCPWNGGLVGSNRKLLQWRLPAQELANG